MIAWLLAVVSWVGLLGPAVAADPLPEPGLTTAVGGWQLSEPQPVGRSEFTLDVFTDVDDCAAVVDEGLQGRCAPWLDAPTRQVHLGLSLRGPDDGLVPMALTPERLRVEVITPGGALPVLERGDGITLTPHQPLGTGQVVVFLIDRSASMYEPRPDHDAPAMVDVVRALAAPQLRSLLFPPTAEGEARVDTRILVLGFSEEVTAAGGGPWQEAPLVRTWEDYLLEVEQLLWKRRAGYTRLYDAIGTTLDDVLTAPRVAEVVEMLSAEPAVVVLTDGFHNEGPGDTCGDNAARLQPLLTTLDRRRADPEARQVRMLLAGFGKPYDPRFVLPGVQTAQVSPRQLCGPYAEVVIDGPPGSDDLESRGIDNASLAFIARHARGQSAVHDDPRALAGFFQRIGTDRYAWYEVDLAFPDTARAWFRQQLPIRLSITRPQAASVRLDWFPNPWLAGPSPRRDPRTGEVLAVPSLWASTSVLLTGSGLTFLLFGMWVGLGHAWRALARRGGVLQTGGEDR